LMNKRFFDSREKKIWALQQIDSFLIANQLVNQTNALTLSLINDNWSFANLPSRESGFRFSGGISNGYSLRNYKHDYIDVTNDYERSAVTYNLHLLTNIKYEKPINLFWQFSINDRLEGGPAFESDQTIQNEDEANTHRQSLYILNSFSTELGYYPNSRTFVTLGLNLSSGFFSTKNKSEYVNPDANESNNFKLSTGLRLTGIYYFSRQLQLNLNAGLNHQFIKYEQEYPIENQISQNNSGNYFFNLGLTYKIF
jgi:hypothetical protein